MRKTATIDLRDTGISKGSAPWTTASAGSKWVAHASVEPGSVNYEIRIIRGDTTLRVQARDAQLQVLVDVEVARSVSVVRLFSMVLEMVFKEPCGITLRD